MMSIKPPVGSCAARMSTTSGTLALTQEALSDCPYAAREFTSPRCRMVSSKSRNNCIA
jgi:hypothetical protein